MIKRIFVIISFLVSLSASAQIEKIVPSKPAVSEGLVHDYAGILTDAEERSLEDKLVANDDSTSNQFVVVTLPTLMDPASGAVYEDEEVALKILRDWGVGQKGKNNGIVLLIVKSPDNKEKKIRIEVGYGLEGAIPDVTAKNIIENSIAPNFKAGDFYGGIDAGVDDIIKAAAGEYKAPEGYGKSKGKGGLKTWMVIAIILFFIISGLSGRGGGGTYASRRGYRGWSSGGWLGGLGGGGWSGGGGGGGWSGGGGGGFGGFGGGSGGGGGASGSW